LPCKEALPAKLLRDDQIITQLIVPDDCCQNGLPGYSIYDGRSEGNWGKSSR
jgi:hypothetical protein